MGSDGQAAEPNGLEPERGTPQTPTAAIVAFIAGVLGLTICPLVGGVAAVVLAIQARREIRFGNGRKTGSSLASVALWLGWAGIVFGLVLLAPFVVFYFLGGLIVGDPNADWAGPQTRPQACSESQWYVDADMEVRRILPKSRDIRNEFEFCDGPGGDFTLMFTPLGSPAAAEASFARSAATQGWQPYGSIPSCLYKDVAGVPTFLHQPGQPAQGDMWVAAVASGEQPTACKHYTGTEIE